MVADGIEREITIAAPREQVWEVLTQPKFLGSWFGAYTAAEIDLRPGGHLPLGHDAPSTPPALIEQVEPPSLFAFRRPRDIVGEAPVERNATLVTFTLTTEPGNHTRLRMVESGFAALALPPEAVSIRFDRNGTGWTRRLTELACRTERLTIRKRG